MIQFYKANEIIYQEGKFSLYFQSIFQNYWICYLNTLLISQNEAISDFLSLLFPSILHIFFISRKKHNQSGN